MTNEEIIAYQAEYRRFTDTVAGKALHLFRNRLVSETMYGERDNASNKRLRENADATAEQYEVLVTEIKRLQALES